MECILINYYPSSCKNIQTYILDSENLNLKKEFENTIDVKDFLNENKVDIIFCYVEKETEIQELEVLCNNIDLNIVIMTKNPELAIDAFRINATDFILTPFNKERLALSVEKVSKKTCNSSNEANNLTQNNNQINDFIFIKSDRKVVKINFEDILFIEGMKDYVVVYTKSNKYITAVNLKTFHTRIPNSMFYRANKSYIININYIKIIANNSIEIEDKKILIGRSYRETIHGFINKHLIRR